MADKTERVSIKLSGDEAARVRRVAAMLPHANVNRIGARAVMAGIDIIERELHEAARRITTGNDDQLQLQLQLDGEGL